MQGKKLRKVAGKYIDTKLLPEVEGLLIKKGFIEAGVKLQLEEGEDSDRDRVIYVYYPNVIQGPGYMQPRVKIEIGSRSLMEPFSIQTFASLLDELYADREFAQAPASIPTVNPERTFLEKVFLLHEEFQRPLEKIRVERMSRHLYDIIKLAKAGYMDKAIPNPALYQTIVEHRQKFNKVGGVDYNLHAPQSINPVPPAKVLNAWKTDYNTMVEQMIYEQNPPSFEQILEEITVIKNKINTLPWQLNFNFSPPNL